MAGNDDKERPMRTWDWDLEARAIASRGLATDSDGNVTTTVDELGQATTAIRLSAAAYALVHRRAPTMREIERLLYSRERTAWLAGAAGRLKGADADERHAIKEIAAWHAKEWSDHPSGWQEAKGRLHWMGRATVHGMVERACRRAGGQADEAIRQYEPGSPERAALRRRLGLQETEPESREREARTFARELAEALDEQAASDSGLEPALRKVAWAVRKAARRMRRPD